MNRCYHCAPVEHRRPGTVCDSCFDIFCDIVAANRHRFQLLLQSSVSRRMANGIMIARSEGIPS